MIRIFCIVLVFLGSILLGIQLSLDPGYVLINVQHWTIETTLWLALFVLILLFMLLYTSLQLINKLSQTPSAIRQWHDRRLAHQAQVITRQGLIEYSEGYWQKAKNNLIKALPNTDTPLLNYLTAARAAQKMGDSQLRDHFLREAQQSMPEAKIAVELTQAQLQLANQQWEQALATLRHLQYLAPHHPYVLKLLMTLYQQVRDWPQLIDLVPILKKYQVIPDHELQTLQLSAYLHAMLDLEKQNLGSEVNQLFNKLPKKVASDSKMVAGYASFLVRSEQYHAAEDILRRALRKEFNPKLIELYSRLPCTERQLLFTESLIKKNAHSAELFLCLGRQTLQQTLWGKAKNYLEKTVELNPTPEAYNQLGTLYEALHEPIVACNQYKKGLELALQHRAQNQ